MEIRLATVDDAAGVAETHVSTVDAFFRLLPTGKREEVRAEELTPFERFALGGPWMETESCRAHLRHVLDSEQWPLVAVEGSRVVGEMEVIVGPDLRWGRTAHIDVLAVRRERQRAGVGRALVEEGRRRAEAAACTTLTTNPEDTAVEFYRKCGLRTVLARQRELAVALLPPAPSPAPWLVPGGPDSFDPLEPLDLVLGRFQTSFATWIKARWSVPGLTGRLNRDEGAIPDLKAYYRLWQYALRPRSASVYVWAPESTDLSALLDTLGRRAQSLGYDALETTVGLGSEPALPRGAATLGKESMLLGTRLGEGRPSE